MSFASKFGIRSAALAVVTIAVPASAATIYQETFGGTTTTATTNAGNAARLTEAGWANGGSTTTSGGSGARIGVFAESGTGFGADRDGVTAADGIAFVYRSNASPSVLYTTEQTIDLSLYQNDVTFDWDQRGDFNGAGIDASLVVQVGGSWYVSNSPFPTGGNTEASWDANQLVYNPAAANWSSLTMGSYGVLPVVGPAAASDLVGNITGFGFLSADGADAGGNETIQFDQLMITATLVPEPATLAVLAVAAPAFLRRRRRSR